MENDYKNEVEIIKSAILKSQSRAANNVNAELLSLYYGVGQYVSLNTRSKNNWGTGAIERISELLHKELPGLRGFSVANLKFMRQFYETWSEDFKILAAEIDSTNDKSLTAVSEINTLQLVSNHSKGSEEFSLDVFLSLGFSHHMIIIRKSQSLEERLFYIRKTWECKWNKDVLSSNIDAKLFEHRGRLPNNFVKTIPDTVQAFKRIQMFKDEYLLDFINVEEIGSREKDIDERIVEQQIVQCYGEYKAGVYGDKKGIYCESKIFDTTDFGYNKITVERPQKDDKGSIIKDKKGKVVADKSLEDSESIPMNEDIDAYFKREVLPYAPDAWYDPKKTKVGYEIPMTRYFYEYQTPEKVEEVFSRVTKIEEEISVSLKALLGDN